jgi:hypothetical protein
MLEPLSFAVSEDRRTQTATYRLTHVTPGRDGTHLTLDVRIDRVAGLTWASMPDLRPRIESEDAEQALDKLAEWMERAAAAIRARGKPKAVLSAYEP